jgi:predicted porin
MNKKLMAAAVAGALTAPGLALAQTAGTNVQIYGVLDVRFDSMKLTQSTSGTVSGIRKEHLSGGSANRIGFRGTEALGGGLTAFFQVETQLFPDARQDVGAQQHTNATLGGRPTFLGLRGGWGEISAGYQDSVYKDVWARGWNVVPTQPHFGIIMGNANTTGAIPTSSCTQAFASGTNAFNGVSTTPNPTSLTVGGASTPAPVLTPPVTTVTSGVAASVICTEAPGNATSFNRTMSNSITFRTPVFAGFRYSTQLALGEKKEPNSATRPGTQPYDPKFSAHSLIWAGGPFSVAAGYEQHVGFRASPTVVGGNRNAKDTGVSIGGRWNYGRGLIGLGWERLKYANTGITAATDNSFTLKNWALQGTFNLTPSDVLFAAYSKTPGKSACGAGAGVCGDASGAKMLSVGMDHSFSKRTAVYAYYSKIDNNSGINYNYPSDSRTTSQAAGAGSGLALGQDSTSYNVGVKHSF